MRYTIYYYIYITHIHTHTRARSQIFYNNDNNDYLNYFVTMC